jgi:hypothetical protein
VATDGEKARSVPGAGRARTWALAVWPVGRGPLKPGDLHCSNGSAPRAN